MKRLLQILALMAGLGSYFSFALAGGGRTPLDSYMDDVRAHHADVAAVRFGAACGVDLNRQTARFGFMNDGHLTWRGVSDLAGAYDHRVARIIGTAEGWKGADRSVVEEWEAVLDLDSYTRTLYCFDTEKKLRAMDVEHFQLHIDAAQRWGLRMLWARGADGKLMLHEPVQFIAVNGEAVHEPKLTADDRNVAQYWRRSAPEAMEAQGLKLAALLFASAG